MKSAFLQGFSVKKAMQVSIYWVSRLLCLVIAKALFRLRVSGADSVPRVGAAIVAANHTSYLDPIIVGVAIRRPVHFMAKEELFRFGPFGWLLRQYQVFPVSRRRIDHQAMKRAVSLLQRGEVVVIFPEGTRGNGIRLRPARPGIGLIAARSRVPVIPLFHQGTEKALPRGAWFPKPHRVSVKFGKPLYFGEIDAGRWQEQVDRFSQTVMERIGALKGELPAGTALVADCVDIGRKATTNATTSDQGEEKG
jgi:1-acyl-sn-glycerol-3-phosphate acyltransferase